MSKVDLEGWSMDGALFKVLVNAELQHSLWPSEQEIPDGWQKVGPVGSKKLCLEWIRDNWVDITPNSLRAAIN